MTKQKLKWVQTDKTCRFWGAFELPYDPAKPTLFLEIEPNTVFSIFVLGGTAFQTKGWRIRQRDAQKENKHLEGNTNLLIERLKSVNVSALPTFKTRKAAKQWVEWYYDKDAVEEKIVSDPAVQELRAK